MKNRCAGLAALLLLIGAVGIGNPYDIDAVLDANFSPYHADIDSAYLVRQQDSFAYSTAGWGVWAGHISDTFYFPGYPFSWAWRVWLKGTYNGRRFTTVYPAPEEGQWYDLLMAVIPPRVMFADYEDPGVEEHGLAGTPLPRLAVSPSVVNRQMTVRLQPVGSGRQVVVMHDAVGNVVRSLDCTGGSDGIVTAKWNRKDEFGRLVPEGVYFCRYAAADVIAVRKVLVTH
jgi:hypothetical protein